MTDTPSLVALARTVTKLKAKRQRLYSSLYAKIEALKLEVNNKLDANEAEILTAREALHAASEQRGGQNDDCR